MKQKIFTIILTIFLGFAILAPVYAQPTNNNNQADPCQEANEVSDLSPLTDTFKARYCDPNSIIVRIINYILSIAAALAILFIIWGGFQYILAGGNEKRIGSATKTLTYAVLGLVVILFAFTIVGLVNFSVKNVR